MGAAGLTVYIVDDDPSVRRALARLLQSAGMRTEVFQAVVGLVGQASREIPDCVIADIRMPVTSGLALPALLTEKGLSRPVIFVTAYDTEENRVAAKQAGAAAFFRKPVDGQALIDAIAWAVEAGAASAGQEADAAGASADKGDPR